MTEGPFSGQVALVTGSSRGIGAATAEALAAAADSGASAAALAPRRQWWRNVRRDILTVSQYLTFNYVETTRLRCRRKAKP